MEGLRIKAKHVIIAIVVLLGLIVVSNGFFTLAEDEMIILERFGRIEAVYVRESTPELEAEIQAIHEYHVQIHTGTGLKFKIPFIDSVVKYTSKLMTYDTPARQVIASDKKTLYFDNNAQWRIRNPLLFRISVGNYAVANDRIDSIVYARMRDRVGKLDSTTLITQKSEIEQLLTDLSREVSRETAVFGVEVYDIRIKRTDLPEGNYASIFNRMITERNRMAAGYRSEGEEIAIEIRSKTDREVTIIISDAYRQAEELRGEGDSEAARIFNEAYGKNPEFFEFYNMLETYRQTIGSSATLVIPLDSEFARFLLGAGIPVMGEAPDEPPDTSPPPPSPDPDADTDGDTDE